MRRRAKAGPASSLRCHWKDGSLDSGIIRDSLIGVDGLVRFLAVEEIRHELDDTWDTGQATDKDDLVHV